MQESAILLLARRAVSTRGRPRSRRPEMAFDLDNSAITWLLGKDVEHGTVNRKLHCRHLLIDLFVGTFAPRQLACSSAKTVSMAPSAGKCSVTKVATKNS